MARQTLFTHRKLRRLAQDLALPVPYVVGLLECLWHVTYEAGQPLLGDALDVELACQWPGERGHLCAALAAVGFIDTLEDSRFAVHDFWDHAPDYVRKRMERETSRKRAYAPRKRPLTAPWREDTDSDHRPPTTANGCHLDELGGRCSPNAVASRTTAELDSPPTPTPTPIEEPPCPPFQGGESGPPHPQEEQQGSTGRDELAEAAARVAKHYAAKVGSAIVNDATGPILALLRAGKREEELTRAADGYAEHCGMHKVEAGKRQGGKRFYGKAGSHTQFLAWKPLSPAAQVRPTQRPRQSKSEMAAVVAALRGQDAATLTAPAEGGPTDGTQ